MAEYNAKQAPLTEAFPLTVTELPVFFWMAIYLAMELMELYRLSQSEGGKVLAYFGSFSNKIDASLIILYFTGLSCRLYASTASGATQEEKMLIMTVSRVLFSLNAILVWGRILLLYSAQKILGAVLTSIVYMIVDVVNFVCVLFFVTVGFGVAIHGLIDDRVRKDESGVFVAYIVEKAVLRPFWQMFGELFLEDIADGGAGTSDEDRYIGSCFGDSHSILSSLQQQKCYKGFVAELLLALYVLISSVMLVNLLIAMMSDTYSKRMLEAKQAYNFNLLNHILQRETSSYHKVLGNMLKLIFGTYNYRLARKCEQLVERRRRVKYLSFLRTVRKRMLHKKREQEKLKYQAAQDSKQYRTKRSLAKLTELTDQMDDIETNRRNIERMKKILESHWKDRYTSWRSDWRKEIMERHKAKRAEQNAHSSKSAGGSGIGLGAGPEAGSGAG